jgi:hypothetical protein
MGLLLSAFLIHGFVPGPEMLTKHLDITYSIIWSLTIAHIMGAGICLSASGLLARLAMVRVGMLLPLVLAVVFIGAFQGSQSWGDVYALVLFGGFGWVMKRLDWPRPPLILGFVLGAIFERYFFISTEIYGSGWITRPIVVIILAGAAAAIWRPLLHSVRDTVGSLGRLRLAMIRPNHAVAFTAAIILAIVLAFWFSRDWPAEARLVPRAASYAALAFALLNLATELFASPDPAALQRAKELVAGLRQRLPHDDPPIAPPLLRARAARYFAWLVGFLLIGAVIGFLPAIWCFVLLLSRLEFAERWSHALLASTIATLALWAVFDRILAVPWPQSLIGDLLPALRAATGLL